MQIVSPKFCSLIECLSVDLACCNYCWDVLMVILYSPHFFATFISWNSFVRKVSPFSIIYFFIQPMNYGNLFYSLGGNPTLSLFVYFCSKFSFQPLGTFLCWPLCSFDIHHTYFPFIYNCFLLSDSIRCYRIILGVSCHNHRNKSFSQEVLVSFIGETYLETKIYVLSVLIAIGVYFYFLGPLSSQTQEMNLYVLCLLYVYFSVFMVK